LGTQNSRQPKQLFWQQELFFAADAFYNGKNMFSCHSQTPAHPCVCPSDLEIWVKVISQEMKETPIVDA